MAHEFVEIDVRECAVHSTSVDGGGFWAVIVHSGAGQHPPDSSTEASQFHKAMKEACAAASEILKSAHGDAISAVTRAIRTLEDNEATNAGYGSNLTSKGKVECDAGIMCGNSRLSAHVGAVSRVKNPIDLACALLRRHKKGRRSLDRVSPLFLGGAGATSWAKRHDVKILKDKNALVCKQDILEVSPPAMRAWQHYQGLLAEEENGSGQSRRKRRRQEGTAKRKEVQGKMMDTVGAICIDSRGRVAAGVSSGGIAMKSSGRIGHAACRGAGCWAQDGSLSSPGISVSTSGCGEEIMHSMLAMRCAEIIQQAQGDELRRKEIEAFFQDGNAEAGIIGLIADKGTIKGFAAHVTPSFGVGYCSSVSPQPSTSILRSVKGENPVVFRMLELSPPPA